MDYDTLRELIQQLNGSYRAAFNYAYAPGSDAFKDQLKRIKDANDAIDAYIGAMESTSAT